METSDLPKLSTFCTSIFLKFEYYLTFMVFEYAGKFNSQAHAQIYWISESWSYSSSMTEIHCKSLFALWCHYNLHVICIAFISSNRVLDEYFFMKCILFDLCNWKWKTEFGLITKLVTEHICIWWYGTVSLCFLTSKSDLYENWAQVSEFRSTVCTRYTCLYIQES